LAERSNIQGRRRAAGESELPLAVMARMLRALGEPNRLRLVQAMTLRCKSVSELARETDMAQPLASHHLGALRDAGLAQQDRRGVHVYY
jgi:ArsR family transcriptional regulator, lead/cadmium/zinc/bismuth-responsive transcriptional repressor